MLGRIRPYVFRSALQERPRAHPHLAARLNLQRPCERVFRETMDTHSGDDPRNHHLKRRM